MTSNFFKVLAYVAIVTSSAVFYSCSKDDNNIESDPTEGLKKVQEFSDDNYTITVYNETSEWRLGYTKVYFAVQDKEGKFVDNAALRSFPEMDMGMSKHSTPRSEITKVQGKPLYEAYYSFLMTTGMNGKWYYDLSYTVGNKSGKIEGVEIVVKEVFRPDGTTPRRVIQSIRAVYDNNKRYVITFVEPQKPKTGSNNMTVYVHERQDANTFVPVENFSLKLDPRMPSMENHSSPNNVDLTWNIAEKIYKGTVNFSMTGYWTLNLILLNEKGETVYGSPVSNEQETSSLYFEVEF